MTITKEELSKQLQEVTDKFEAQFNKCPDDIKKQLPEFIDILKKQSQIFQNRSENFPKHSLTDDRSAIYNILSLDLQTIIRYAEWVIENSEIGRFYDGFLYAFGSNVNQIKKFQQKIEDLDSDYKKYFTCMDKIYSFYDKLDKLENIQEKLTIAEKEHEGRKKKFEEEHFLDTIDEQLQNQYIYKFAEKIKEIITKAAPGEIKTYTLDWFIDDQAHFLMMKGKYPILYMTRHLGVLPTSPLYDALDKIKDAHYSITICCSPEVSFQGDYDTLEALVNLIPEKTESAPEEIRINIPDWQRKGLTAKGLDMALFSMKDFDWKK